MDYSITCLYRGEINTTIIHKVLYVAVSRGTKYNVGKYPGRYYTSTESDAREYHRTEDESDGEMVERLPEIVETYAAGDVTKDMLSIGLADTRGDPVDYLLSIAPRKTNELMIGVKTNTDDAGVGKPFVRLVNLVEEFCKRFEIYYAGFTTEFESMRWPSAEDIGPDDLRLVTYLSPDLAESVGRGELLSVPAHEITSHDDGGIFVVVSTDPDGHRAVDQARDHLRD